MVDLAVHSEKESVTLGSIAMRENISEAYLEQLISKLKRAQLVNSTRGAQGGYRLAKRAEEISVGEVLTALEGNLDAVQCPGLSEEGCQTGDLCVAKYVWQKVNESIAQTVNGIYLSDLAEESRRIRENTPDREQDQEKGSAEE